MLCKAKPKDFVEMPLYCRQVSRCQIGIRTPYVHRFLNDGALLVVLKPKVLAGEQARLSLGCRS